MENLPDCPLPPRRFRSKWGKLLFSLYDSYIIYALAVMILTICYTAVFTLQHREELSFNELNVQTTATIINFEESIHRDNQKNRISTYYYTLSYAHKGIMYQKKISIRRSDIINQPPTETGADIVIYVHLRNPSNIRLFPQTEPTPLPVFNILGILIFTILPALVIQNRRSKRLALLPILEMGLPTYAEITKKNISALANSGKSTIEYPLEFVAFDGKAYKTSVSAAPRAFDNKPVLLLYNLSNPNEYMAPNAIASPPKFNDDGSLSPYLDYSTLNALLLAIGLSIIVVSIMAGSIYFNFSH